MKPTRILMIEDDTAFGTVASALLARAAQDCRWQLNVTQMVTLREAEKYAHGYDAVILDLGLPDSDTEETMAWLKRKSPELPPVVVVTGSDFDVIRNRCMRDCGAADFMWRGDVTVNPINCFQRVMHAIWRKEFCRKTFRVLESNAA